MTADTLRELDAFRREWPDAFSSPLSDQEIAATETEVGVLFSQDYKQFLRLYGGGMFGPYPVFGLRAPAWGGINDSVLDMTRAFRAQGWPGTDSWAVISLDHAGNPIGIAADGTIWRHDHDGVVTEQIAQSFEDFVRWLLSRND